MKQIKILDDGFTRDIIIYAFRYALGRRSMSVSIFTDWCTVNINLLSVHDRQLIIREINDAEELEQLGDAGIDDVRWFMFRDLLKRLCDET